MDIHPLKNLLQLQLNSDRNAVLHLPHVLSVLNVECFQPSPHLQKWIARVNSLVVSKDFGARWAGLSIALQTAKCSRDLMMECAQPWVTATLPNLSVRKHSLSYKYSFSYTPFSTLRKMNHFLL